MSTNSRYDFMNESTVVDEVTGTHYPDPLSLNYLNLKLSEDMPIHMNLTEDQISFFWRQADKVYGSPCWDDVVLTLNGIPHRNFLKPGDTIYFPLETDIKTSFNKTR